MGIVWVSCQTCKGTGMACKPRDIHPMAQYMRRDWWPLADAITKLGYDVKVFDADVEPCTLWGGDPNRGTVEVWNVGDSWGLHVEESGSVDVGTFREGSKEQSW